MAATADAWDDLQAEADLLALHITLGQLKARHRELTGTTGDPANPQCTWDNTQVSKERRARARARHERAKAGNALTRLLRRSA